MIKRLYEVERRIAQSTPALRQEERTRDSAPVLAQMKEWLDQQKLVALPKSPFGKAVTYALNNWEALNTYLTNGILTIDNNRSENALRGTAVGRKNWLFIGSMDGGKTAAVITSIIRMVIPK